MEVIKQKSAYGDLRDGNFRAAIPPNKSIYFAFVLNSPAQNVGS